MVKLGAAEVRVVEVYVCLDWEQRVYYRERLKVLCWGTNHVCNLITLRRIPIFVDVVWASLCHWDGYHGYFGHVFESSQTVIVMSWSTAVMMPNKHNVDDGWSTAEARNNDCEDCSFCLKCAINMCLMKARILCRQLAILHMDYIFTCLSKYLFLFEDWQYYHK